MKSLVQIAILTLCMLVSIPTNAQFLKKLGNKISEAAENTVTRKSAEKTSDEVSKGMDGIFSGMKGKDRSDVVSPEKHYEFDYRYKMKMSTGENTVMMDYFFKQNQAYAGMAMAEKGINVFMIFDYNKETAYSFMTAQERKMYTATSLDLGTENDWVNDTYTKSEYRVTELPNKTFLGYSCKGKQIENDEWKFTMYYTNEVGVSFQNILNASKEKQQGLSVLSKYFEDAEDGLMLYMQSVDKKNENFESMTMECVSLDKEKRDFSTKNYSPMMGF